MHMIPLNMPHTHWRQFEEQVRQIPYLQQRDDWYQVEVLASGLWVCIQKNGHSYKSRNSNGGFPHDYLLKLYNPHARSWVWIPHYTKGEADTRSDNRNGLMQDISLKLARNRESALEFVNILYDVAAGAEPGQLGLRIGALPPLPGKAIDEILYCFKWLFAQEGVNYPVPKQEGRLYPLKRIQEIVDGVDIDEVISRCASKQPDRKGVNYRVIYDKLGL